MQQKYDHVLFISMDTCRADHLGCYGHSKKTTPILSKFCEENIIFEKSFTSCIPTLPSHTTVFTSLYQGVHGAEVTLSAPMPEKLTTIAEVLKRQGHITAAFHSGAQLSEIWNVFKGFDIVNYASTQSIKETAGFYKEFIEANKDKKTFGFVHGLDMHFPHYKPGLFSDELKVDKQRVIDKINDCDHDLTGEGTKTEVCALYDDSIVFFDRHIGTIFDKLKELGIYDKTIIVIFGDHGEEFGERSKMAAHHKNLFDELIRVPFLLRIPGLEPKKIRTNVRLIDIMPTVLAAMGINEQIIMQGENLLPTILGTKSVDLPVFTEYLHRNSYAISIKTSFLQLICERENTFLRKIILRYRSIRKHASKEPGLLRRLALTTKLLIIKSRSFTEFDTITFCDSRSEEKNKPRLIVARLEKHERRIVNRLLELINKQMDENKLLQQELTGGVKATIELREEMKKSLEELNYL